jgi:spore maturation protein CgeB
LVFFVPFRDEIDFQKLKEEKKSKKTKTLAWMCDDKWRWEHFGKRICWSFDYVATTDIGSVRKYRRIGYKNVILTQWGINKLYKNISLEEKTIDVSFVGQVNPWRKYVIDRLVDADIKVDCYGYGWKNGRVEEKTMFDIFQKSKINLNISNSIQWNWKYLLRINWDVDKKMDLPHQIINMFPLIHTLFFPKRKEDLKARFFEVTGSGGFLLSYNVESLNKYFEIGKEIVCYQNIDDLIIKIKYFLKNDKKRKNIAELGYLKTKNNFTYHRIFADLFNKISLYEK